LSVSPVADPLGLWLPELEGFQMYVFMCFVCLMLDTVLILRSSSVYRVVDVVHVIQ
jgi:hypothetical protein